MYRATVKVALLLALSMALLAMPVLDSGAFSQEVSGSITLYTSQPQDDVSQLISGFKVEHPDVEVKVFRSGTEEVVSRFLMEVQGGSPQADLLFVADAPTLERLKERNLLEPYASP
ncbi:MAG TPA: extracellular solute-binding protein, partial [Thermosynergistes sp.]|nr:extracellular solute-binding protein [Thermosynergistes sp.]